MGTVAYLDNPAHADVNVVMWSWCSVDGHDVAIYLDNFDQLTTLFAAGGTKGRTADNAVTFVWMTGYAWGSDGDSINAIRSPYKNHKTIVEHCIDKGYFCLDYWSQDVYNYGDDSYKPTEGGNTNVQHYEYTQTHSDWFYCRNWTGGDIQLPAHANQHLTSNRRAYSAWWIWARIAGWDGTLENE